MTSPIEKQENPLLISAFRALSNTQRKRLLQVLLFFCCLLVVGFVYLAHPPVNRLQGDLRVLPVFLITLLVVVYILQLTVLRKALFLPLSPKRPLLAAFVVMFVLSVTIQDVLAVREPFLLIPGMLALSLIYWNSPKVIFYGAVCTCVGLCGEFYFTQCPLLFEYAAFFVLSSLLAALTALVIRGNAISSQKRVQTLQDENRELWDLSYRDALTGLFNRRYIQQAAEQVFNRAVRYREALHVLMIDIDHFKKVNDTLGHAVGDEVLKAVAASIQSFVRSSDIVARYGGEEFIIYIVESSTETTQYVANRIRDGVASLRLADVPWPITISIGIASLKENDRLGDQVARADQCLYLSKKNGRNRVTGS